jgi:hypothetical protein
LRLRRGKPARAVCAPGTTAATSAAVGNRPTGRPRRRPATTPARRRARRFARRSGPRRPAQGTIRASSAAISRNTVSAAAPRASSSVTTTAPATLPNVSRMYTSATARPCSPRGARTRLHTSDRPAEITNRTPG